jgi:hypothetical protein
MTPKQIQKEIDAAKKALENIAPDHKLAPESFKDELRENAREMRCGGMFNYSPRKAGQSYNAMYAEQRGELTKSKLPAVLKRILAAGFAQTSMWHHTGMFKGHMNETEFFAACDFDLDGYSNYLLNKDEIEAERAAEANRKEQQRLAYEVRKKEIADQKTAWLKENCNYVERVQRRLFVEDKREMNGKYGWFDSSSKSYNMPEYFTGWELKEGVNEQEYYEIGQKLLQDY